MIELKTVLLIIWAHCIGDFFLQSDWMAMNKSTNNEALGAHVLCYSVPFLVVAYPHIELIFINVVLHFCVDWVTSRITKHFKGRPSAFFNTIGVDQAIHLSLWFITWGIWA